MGPAIAVVVILLLIALGLGAAGAVLLAMMPAHFKHTRPRHTEAISNLRAAFAAETAYFREKGRYDECIETVGFLPERGNRYRYVLSQTGDSYSPGDPLGSHSGVLADTLRFPTANNSLLLSGIPPALFSSAGIDATGITIIAAGDIDSDPTIDVWSISTNNRVIDGGFVPAGLPFRHVDDAAY